MSFVQQKILEIFAARLQQNMTPDWIVHTICPLVVQQLTSTNVKYIVVKQVISQFLQRKTLYRMLLTSSQYLLQYSCQWSTTKKWIDFVTNTAVSKQPGQNEIHEIIKRRHLCPDMLPVFSHSSVPAIKSVLISIFHLLMLWTYSLIGRMASSCNGFWAMRYMLVMMMMINLGNVNKIQETVESYNAVCLMLDKGSTHTEKNP